MGEVVLIRRLVEADAIRSGSRAQASARLIVGVKMKATHEIGCVAVEVTKLITGRMLEGRYGSQSILQISRRANRGSSPC